jgi:hypothetical protein
MFAENSLIERPPEIFEMKLRLSLEAIAFSIRAILTSLSAIEEICGYLNKSHRLPDNSHTVLCMNCWSIIDQTNMLCLLLNFLDNGRSEYISKFVKKHQIMKKLRDKMDHLNSNIPNLAAKKKTQSTIFGCLSFFQYPAIREDGSEDDSFGVIYGIPFGSSIREYGFRAPNPFGKTISARLSLFTFSAFDLTVSMDELSNDIRDLIINLEGHLSSLITKAVEDHKPDGITVEEFLAQPPLGLVISVDFHPKW